MRQTLLGACHWCVVLIIVAAPRHAASRARPRGPAFVVAPEPSWIAPTSPLPPASSIVSAETTSNGRRHLFSDHQVRVLGKEEESYWRWTRQITNESGLQALSQVTIDFDATYQTLIIHAVTVRRGEATFSRLDRNAVRIVQREPDLERQVFSGLQSAVLFVSDLRVGDILDYAYTLRGADPTLEGRYVDALVFGFPEPVDRLRVRLLFPTSRLAIFKHHGPEQGRHFTGGTTGSSPTEYLWDLRSLPAYQVEPDAPSWHSFYPWMQVSEFASWEEVASWGTRLFRGRSKPTEALRAWARATQGASKDRDDFPLRAARFVQDEVRYVGIEVGMSRRRPSDPADVFERRYGDCKDKTALLVALLRLGGVSAHPLLVSSGLRHTLGRWLPSPGVFDHVIVRATGADEKTYFVDTTVALQGGGLAAFEHSPFAFGLRLDDDAKALEMLPAAPVDRAPTQITDTFAVASPGSTDATKLDVEHFYRGELADGMRKALRATTREQLGKQYLEMYQQRYPSLREAAPLEHADDRDHNVIGIAAHFAIPQFWKWSEPEHQYAAEVVGHFVETYLKRPAAPKPDVPIALNFPTQLRHVMHLTLPFDLPLAPQQQDAQSAAFGLTFASNQMGRTISYTYDLSIRAPAATPPDVLNHVAAVDKARDFLVRTIISRPEPASTGANWTAIVGALGLVPIVLFGARLVYRYEPPPVPVDKRVSGPIGLRGWLYFVGAGVLVNPFRFAAEMVGGSKVLFSRAQWQAMTTAGTSSYRPALAAAIVAELVVLGSLAVLSALLIHLFFRKRRSFPPLYCVLLIAAAGFLLIDEVGALAWGDGSDTQGTPGVAAVRNAIATGVWVTYLKVSKRVAATFVN